HRDESASAEDLAAIDGHQSGAICADLKVGARLERSTGNRPATVRTVGLRRRTTDAVVSAALAVDEVAARLDHHAGGSNVAAEPEGSDADVTAFDEERAGSRADVADVEVAEPVDRERGAFPNGHRAAVDRADGKITV